jgi:hypothetical protein
LQIFGECHRLHQLTKTKRNAAAGGIALINTLGLLGEVISPAVTGLVKSGGLELRSTPFLNTEKMHLSGLIESRDALELGIRGAGNDLFVALESADECPTVQRRDLQHSVG